MINNPSTGTLTSSVIAGFIVAILAWVLGLPQFGGTIIPPQIQMALMGLVTWGLSFVVHNPPDTGISAPPASKGFARLGALIAITAVGLALLGACTTTGGLAGKGKPVDWAVTVNKGCNALKVGIASIDAVYTGDPAIFGNTQNANVYAGAKKLVLDSCGTTPPTDLQSAAANLLVAAADVGQLITTLKTNGVIK